MMRGFVGGALVLFSASMLAAMDLNPDNALSKQDVGVDNDNTQPERWSLAQKDGERSYRIGFCPKLSRVALTPWWEGDTPADDVIIAITYRDKLSGPVTVGGWTGAGGIYGNPVIGRIGGENDGKWKTDLLLCRRDNILRHPDGEWAGKWTLIFSGPELELDRIEVHEASDELRKACVDSVRKRRAKSVAARQKEFKHVPFVDDTKLGEVPSKFEKLGFIPYSRPYCDDVHPSSVPKKTEWNTDKKIKAYACLGEYEPIQIAAYALRNQKLNASVSDFKGPDGALLKTGSDIELFMIESRPMRPNSSWGKEWQIRPVWMRPVKPVELEKGKSQSWYIRIHVPENAKPGDYSAEAMIFAEKGGVAKFPISLQVLPFKLNSGDYAWGVYNAGVSTDEQIEDMRSHGIQALGIFADNGFAPKMVDGKCVAKIEPGLNDYFKKLKKAGFREIVIFGGGDTWWDNPHLFKQRAGVGTDSPEFDRRYMEFWKDMKRQEKANEWPEIICCPFDEPVKSGDKMKAFKRYRKLVKKAVPEMKVFGVFMNKPDAHKQLGDAADIWSCNGAFAENQKAKNAANRRGGDKKMYTYAGSIAGYRPGASRANAGLVPWHYDADATYFWAYDWSCLDPFNDLDGGTRDWTPSAYDVDGKLYSSIAWEGIREGIDDRRYIETCAKMAEEKGRADILDEIDTIKRRFKSGGENEESVRTGGFDDFFINLDDNAQLDAIRNRMAEKMLEMAK